MSSLLVLLFCHGLCSLVQCTDVQLLPPFEILNFTKDNGTAWRKRMGIVILDVDEVIEEEFPKLLDLPDGVVLYHARMGKGPKVTAGDLVDLEHRIPNASALLPPFKYDVIGFACTSAATEIGEQKLGQLVANGLQSVGGTIAAAQVTNPLTAAKRALNAVGAKNIAVLTPYTKDISVSEVDNFIAAGFIVQHVAYFNQTLDYDIVRITPDSVLQGIIHLADLGNIDAVFVSCTNVRILPVLDKARKMTGKAVISSNTAMAWDMMRLAGLLQPSSVRGGLVTSTPEQLPSLLV